MVLTLLMQTENSRCTIFSVNKEPEVTYRISVRLKVSNGNSFLRKLHILLDFGRQPFKSMKFNFKRVIGETKLTFEDLTTVLAQIESCLNRQLYLLMTKMVLSA